MVQPLCDCLNDKDPQIREQAGIVLQVITGENVFSMDYNPNSPENDRKQFIKEIKAYWQEQYPEK